MTIVSDDRTGMNHMRRRSTHWRTAVYVLELTMSEWSRYTQEKADTHSHSDAINSGRGIVEPVSRPDDFPVLSPGEHTLRTSLDTGGTIPYLPRHLNGDVGLLIARNLLVKASLNFNKNVPFLLTGSGQVDLTSQRIAFYALRRSQPTEQPLLNIQRYALPRKGFVE